jgi:hypothetical protein
VGAAVEYPLHKVGVVDVFSLIHGPLASRVAVGNA